MKRRVILYISMSVDGCIADWQGGVGWLDGQGEGYEGDFGYGEFIRGVDTVLMGGNTYRQITRELSPGAWPYEGMECFVFTNRRMERDPHVRFVRGDPASLVEELKARPEGKDIWVCGGADLAGQLMKDRLIDVYHLTVMPVLLGRGLRLFPRSFPFSELRLERAREYDGVMDLVYTLR